MTKETKNVTEEIDFAALAAQAAELDDQTETKASVSFELPPVGKTVARLVEYVELGKHDGGEYQGKKKADVDKVRIVFELLGPKHIRDVDGVKSANRIVLPPMAKILDEKAKFKKLFEKMRYGRANIKNMAQMLNEPFFVQVVHNTTGEGKDLKTYANITDKEGSFLISAPIMEVLDEDGNATGETRDISKKVPAAISKLRMFLFNLPTKATWDSLFMEGEYENKDAAGKVTKRSKNTIQNLIKSAINFEGSELFNLLGGVSDLPEIIEAVAETKVETKPKTSTKKKEVQPEPEVEPESEDIPEVEEVVEAKAPAKTTKSAAAKQQADDLSALGLV